MDREECPLVVEVGGASATTVVPEGPIVDPHLSEACEPAVASDRDDIAPLDVQTPTPHTMDAEHEAVDQATPARVVEALLFSSDSPLSAARLAELAGAGSAREVRGLIDELNETYAAVGLSFRIEAIARGYQMLTRPEYQPWLAKLNKHAAQTRLSAAALEALSIVAYKQPVIRADIEAVRGVGCGEVLNRLREMGLIRIVGRAEIVGRPMLYGTTRKFLDVFGLADVEDLPPLEALSLRRPSTVRLAESETPAEDEDEPRQVAAGA